MNSFRLVLCLAGLLAYLVAKHFTTPDGSSGLPASGSQLLGVGMSLPDTQVDPAVIAHVGSSNSQPSFLEGTSSEDINQAPPSGEQAARRADLNVIPVLGRN
jgi:hypothetical protein